MSPSPPPPADESPRSWLAPLGATLALQTTSSFLYNVIPTLAPIIVAASGTTQSFIGALTGLSTLGSIAFMLAGTPLIRRYGAIRILQTGVLLGGVGLVLFNHLSAAAIAFGALLMGLGYGPSSPAGSGILQRYAPARHRVLIFSIRQAGMPLSGVAAGLLLPYLYTVGGWLAVTLATLALVAATIAVVQPLRAEIDANRVPDEPIGASRLLSPANLLVPFRAITVASGLARIAVAGACLATGHGCWSAYFVTYATEALGYSLIDAGAAFAAMQAGGILGRLGLGFLADRLGSGVVVLRTVALISAGLSVTLVAAGTAFSYPALCLLAAFAGGTVSGWNGVQVAVIAGRVPTASITASAAGATILVFLGFIAGPAMFAVLLATTGSFTAGFLATAAATFLAAPLLMGVGSDPRHG